VLLHAANAVLVFLALRRLTGAAWRSAAVAAFFAVHPLHVESVAWVAERKDVLSTLFWMLALWAYARYAECPWPGRYLLVVMAFAAGLLAKPMVVTLPCVLLLLDYWPLGRLRLGRDPGAGAAGGAGRLPPASVYRLVGEKLPLLALAGGVCVLTVLAQRGAVKTLEQFPLPVRVLNALLAYVTYAGKMFWPHPLAAFYPHPGARLPVGQAVAAGLALACVSALVVSQAGAALTSPSAGCGTWGRWCRSSGWSRSAPTPWPTATPTCRSSACSSCWPGASRTSWPGSTPARGASEGQANPSLALRAGVAWPSSAPASSSPGCNSPSGAIPSPSGSTPWR
jgi:hypothetical protein